MSIDTTTPRSRRALLAAGAGGLAAAAAATLGRAMPARADGESIVVGGEYETAESPTSILNATTNADVLIGASDGGGIGVYGISSSSHGVRGEGGDTGVSGFSFNGVALSGRSDNGLGLRVIRGRIRVDEVSGVAIIQAGATSTTVSPGIDINERTFVLLTPMSNIGSRGLWFTKNANADTFTIRMSGTRGRSTKVAWLALERG